MKEVVYQLDSNNYFIGATYAYNGLLPAGTVKVQPEIIEGFIPKWNGESFDQIENHIGTSGYIGKEHFEMKEYGPLPEGFSLDIAYSLEEVKEQQKAIINAKRDSLELGGFEYLGSIFDTDEKAYMRIVGADNLAMKAVQAKQDFSIEWTLADNSQKTMNAEEMLGLLPAFAFYSDSLHKKANLYKEQIDSSNTIEEVKAIVWTE